jgi:outer membrane protein insertion porin family
MKKDTKNNTVDLTLKVKERGKNTVQLNGGVSAIAGSFIGFSYSTNNFLGLGENLSLSTTLGTVQRSAQIGFTEPYFLDRPLQVGFTVFTSRYSFDQARQASILSGQNLTQLFSGGNQQPAELCEHSRGVTAFMSYR